MIQRPSCRTQILEN